MRRADRRQRRRSGKVEGVKTVAVYPAQHSVGVLFAGKGDRIEPAVDRCAGEGRD